MDKREALKSMLNNIINDKSEEASVDLHNYLTVKMREVAGLGAEEQVSGTADDAAVGDAGEVEGAPGATE